MEVVYIVFYHKIKVPRQDGNTESEALLGFAFLTVVWLCGSVHI